MDKLAKKSTVSQIIKIKVVLSKVEAKTIMKENSLKNTAEISG